VGDREHAPGSGTALNIWLGSAALLIGCLPDVFTVSSQSCRAAMPITKAKDKAGRIETINLLATSKQKILIDRAAEALGRSRSDFILDTACREAESVLLDRRYFALSEEVFKRFTSILDRPPKDNPRLRRLLHTKAPWDR
jgi:uncharacterized protein (DUF1778 family)